MATPQNRYSRFSLDSGGNLRDAWGRFISRGQVVESYESNITHTDRRIQRSELSNLLLSNVCEVIFIRRRPERAKGRPLIRRMLCTNSGNILNSNNGLQLLNYRLPQTGKKVNEAQHNLVVAWDIFMQDYRNISMDNCYIRTIIPGDDTFWKYYNDVLSHMTPAQKLSFMDTFS